MLMTIVEAHVAPEKWATLEQAFTEEGKRGLPPAILQTLLVRSREEPTLWQIVTLFRSLEAREEMHQATGRHGAVLIFRAAGAEPTVSMFDVVGSSIS